MYSLVVRKGLRYIFILFYFSSLKTSNYCQKNFSSIVLKEILTLKCRLGCFKMLMVDSYLMV